MKPCREDWRTCGHCIVLFAPDTRPGCTKAGIWDKLFGNDTCPNAPMPDQFVEGVEKEGS